MKIDDEKIEHLITEKFSELECPLCHAKEWAVSNKIFQLSEFNKGDLIIGGPLYLVFPVVCNKCGNTYFFNPFNIGLLKNSEGKKDVK